MSAETNVTLPREVADAIETIKDSGYDNRHIFYAINHLGPGSTYKEANIIKTYATKDNFDNLMRALVNGYEKELTPEEKVREYYCDPYRGSASCYGDVLVKRAIIKETLDILGVKIEGVND